MMRRFFASTIRQDEAGVFDSVTEINGLKLRIPSYSGPLAEIERLSDNTTLDVFPDGTGYVNETDISDFCSGTTGRYRTIYGQKGVNNITQTIFSQMPYCFKDGAVTKLDGIVALDFNDTENLAMQYSSPLESINADGFFFLCIGSKDPLNNTAQQLLSHSTANRQFRLAASGGESVELIGSGDHLRASGPAEDSKIKGFKTLNLDVDAIVFKGNVDGPEQASTGIPATWQLNQVGRRSTSSEIFSGKIHEYMYWDSFLVTMTNEMEIRQQLVNEYD